jgi:hypothetical protein
MYNVFSIQNEVVYLVATEQGFPTLSRCSTNDAALRSKNLDSQRYQETKGV